MNIDTILIEGFIRRLEKFVYSNLIPSSINNIIYTFYDPWIDLNPPPIKLIHRQPQPLYYDGKIILAPFAKDSRHIFCYDINDDIFSNKWQYPDGFEPRCHGQVVFESKGLLYIFNGSNNSFGILDLNMNSWHIRDDEFTSCNLRKNVYNPFSCYISSPIEQIHTMNVVFYEQGKHQYFDGKKDCFVTLESMDKLNETVIGSRYGVLLYVKSINIMLLIDGYRDHTAHFIDIDEDGISNFGWQQLIGFKLPFQTHRFRGIVVLDAVLIIWNEGDLWYIDIGDRYQMEYKWNKSVIKVSDHKSLRIVATKNNYVHFINFHIKPTTHSKIHLSRLIPYELIVKYTK